MFKGHFKELKNRHFVSIKIKGQAFFSGRVDRQLTYLSPVVVLVESLTLIFGLIDYSRVDDERTDYRQKEISVDGR